MKTTRRILALVLSLLFITALCGCGNSDSKSDDAGKADTASSAADAPAVTEAPDHSGAYTIFGVKSSSLGDSIFSVEGLDSLGVDTSMKITLNADGTGSVASGENSGTFKWNVEGETLTMTADEDGSSVTAVIKNGVLEWAIGNETIYLAKDGADTSSYNVKSLSDLAGDAVQSGIDEAAQGE